MYTEIVAAVQSTKTLTELIKSAKGLSNQVELLSAVNAVQEKLSQALVSNLEGVEKQSALSSEVRELKEKLREAENWERQIQRYQLQALPTGTLAYSLKEGMEEGEPHHYLCTSCVDNKQKSIMQPSGRTLVCPKCDTRISIKHSEPLPNRSSDWRV